MRLINSNLQDAYLVELMPQSDARGGFCRLFCERFFEELGCADHHFVQVNLSDNTNKGTLRGLHYQAEPYLEAKIIYCLQGTVYDVIVDLRKHSPTYLHHFGVQLTATVARAIYVPKGFAHGFLTLEDNSRLLYLMSEFYKPGFERGYRYDDPAFGISWPSNPVVISEKDLNYLPFESNHALPIL